MAIDHGRIDHGRGERASYYLARTESGDAMPDPSEDGLYMLFEDLDELDNTFVVIEPAQSDHAWFVTVTLRPDGDYDVVRHDIPRREHEVGVAGDMGELARELTVWLAGRFDEHRTPLR